MVSSSLTFASPFIRSVQFMVMRMSVRRARRRFSTRPKLKGGCHAIRSIPHLMAKEAAPFINRKQRNNLDNTLNQLQTDNLLTQKKIDLIKLKDDNALVELLKNMQDKNDKEKADLIKADIKRYQKTHFDKETHCESHFKHANEFSHCGETEI